MNSLEQLRRKPFSRQLLKNRNGLPLRSDHADVSRTALYRPAQYPHVVPMSARDNNQVSRFPGAEPRHCPVEIFSNDLFGVGKPLSVGVGVAIIHHGNVEPGTSRNLAKI